MGSIPAVIIGIFQWHNPTGRTVVLGLTQPLTEMSIRCISWADNLTVPLLWNLGTLTPRYPLGHSRPVTGLLYLYDKYVWIELFFNDAVIIFLAWYSGSQSTVINLSAKSYVWLLILVPPHIVPFKWESTDFLTTITAVCTLKLITLCRLKQWGDSIYDYNNKREHVNITQSTLIFK